VSRTESPGRLRPAGRALLAAGRLEEARSLRIGPHRNGWRCCRSREISAESRPPSAVESAYAEASV
jgi:hypothetical protein